MALLLFSLLLLLGLCDICFCSQWRKVIDNAPFPVRIEYSAVTVVSTLTRSVSIIITGGAATSNTNYFNDVWLSTNGLNWNQITSNAPWVARHGFSLIAIPPTVNIPLNPLSFNTTATNNSTLILMAGQNYDSSLLNDIWSSYDLGYTWSLLTSSAAWSPRFFQSVTLVSNNTDQMILSGGLNYISSKESLLSDIWISAKDSFGRVWLQLTATASFGPRAYHSSFYMLSSIFISNGAKLNPDVANLELDSNAVYRSSDLGITWQSVGIVPQDFGVGLHGASLVVNPERNRVFSISGFYAAAGYCTKDMSYSIDGQSWNIEPISNPLPYVSRSLGSAAVLYPYDSPFNYSIFVFSGDSDTGTPHYPNDIWAWSPGPPSPVTSITVALINSTMANVSIALGYDGGLSINKLELIASTPSNNKLNSISSLYYCYPSSGSYSSTSSVCICSLSGLIPSSSYSLSIIAMNNIGSSDPLTISFSTIIPTMSPTIIPTTINPSTISSAYTYTYTSGLTVSNLLIILFISFICNYFSL